jgi:hypothetical protein
MAFISISYDEPNTAKYQSVSASLMFKEDKREFTSGNFVKDWYDAIKFLIHESEDGEPWSQSSSVDHFIMDGAPFESAYLVRDNLIGTYQLSYRDENSESGIEFFVEKGTRPTWDELKELCK